LTGTPIHLVFDLVLGIGLLVCLILDWVCLSNSYADRGLVMLGTYGTNFLICNWYVPSSIYVLNDYKLTTKVSRTSTSSASSCKRHLHRARVTRCPAHSARTRRSRSDILSLRVLRRG
jgi:hypothetical protein